MLEYEYSLFFIALKFLIVINKIVFNVERVELRVTINMWF